MKRVIAFVMAICLFFGIGITAMTTTASAATTGTYPQDIRAHAYEGPIAELWKLGALNGTVDSAGKFYPDAECSRATFAVMLHNLWRGTGVDRSWFNDNSATTQSWACQVMQIVSSAVGHEVIWNGVSNTAITRGEACSMIVAMLNCDNRLRQLVGTSGESNSYPSTPSTNYPSNDDYYYNNGNVCGFYDVPQGCYYAQPVEWAVGRGVCSGTSNTSFSPSNTCSLAEVLTFLWRAKGSPSTSYRYPFYYNNGNDSYFYSAACWASSKGIIADDKVDPTNSVCTRAYLVWAMWKLAGSPSVSSSYYRGFQDIPSGASYRTAVGWAVRQGITSGTSSTTFDPMGLLSRAEVITFLYRAYGPYAR